MNPKELIVKIKEYADIADASYAIGLNKLI